jgi:hypothetical protein
VVSNPIPFEYRHVLVFQNVPFNKFQLAPLRHGFDKSNNMAKEVAYATTVSKCELVNTNLNMGRWLAFDLTKPSPPPPHSPPPATVTVVGTVTLDGYTAATFGGAAALVD